VWRRIDRGRIGPRKTVGEKLPGNNCGGKTALEELTGEKLHPGKTD
jgi:hypothetical protein